jgi:hypothetical protein
MGMSDRHPAMCIAELADGGDWQHDENVPHLCDLKHGHGGPHLCECGADW